MKVFAVVAGSAVILAALASCSSSGTGSLGGAAGASSSPGTLAVWQQFAACARTHGVPTLPDPELDSAGKVSFPGFDKASAPPAVMTSCGSILDQLPPSARPNAAPTDIPALLRYAQCMRHHGFPDWPDPKSDGTFPAAQLPTMKTPAVVSAMQACDRLNPDGAGRVYGS